MKAPYAVILTTAILLSACGGGDPLFSDNNGSAGGATLSSSNAQTAAKVSFQSLRSSADLIGVGGTLGLTANGIDAISKSSLSHQSPGSSAGVLQKDPFGPDVIACVVSGTITLSGDIADPLTLTRGDFVNLDADACDDGFGETLDGLMSLTIAEFTGDFATGLYMLGMDVTLDSLQVTTATDVVSNTGDAAITLDTTNIPFVSASVSGNSMTRSSNASTETLTNYSTSQSADGGFNPPPYTLASQGTVDSSLLTGTVNYSTPVQFQGFALDFPDSGELLVVGFKSSLRLIALDNVNVRIELDNDADGTVDEVVDTTWAALVG